MASVSECLETKTAEKTSLSVEIPIFVISFNRLWCLLPCLESLKKLGNVRIIFIDNGSTYPPVLEFLRASGCVIYWRKPLKNQSDLYRSINESVKDWFDKQEEPKPSIYGVTDPDIVIDNPSPKFLEICGSLLTTHKHIHAVGPSLRIDDIPAWNPLKRKILQRHARFWSCPVGQDKGLDVQFTRSPIDTTLAFYRTTYVKTSVTCRGLRLRHPYTAAHLDWYIDPGKLEEDQQLYLSKTHGLAIAHWSSSYLPRSLVSKDANEPKSLDKDMSP